MLLYRILIFGSERKNVFFMSKHLIEYYISVLVRSEIRKRNFGVKVGIQCF